jgi:hypothetical protein
MQRLSDKLVLLGGEPTFFCPGCKMLHRVNVYTPNDHTNAMWTWNGSREYPSFSPSIHIVGRCHSFVRDGKIQFLPDCNHDLAGSTVDLPDIPIDEID